MLFIEVQEPNLKQVVEQIIKSNKHKVHIQQTSISSLQPIIDYFSQQYFYHLPKSELLENINNFFTKLLSKVLSIDILRNIYYQLSIQVRKLHRYQEYIKQINEISQEENYQQCSHNRKFSDMLCDPINFEELNTSAFKNVNKQSQNAAFSLAQFGTTILTLQQDIESLPEFNFYEPIKNIGDGQLLQEWTDQFIEKKLQSIKSYKITHKESIDKNSPKQSVSTTGTKKENQLTFHRSLQIMITSGITEKSEEENTELNQKKKISLDDINLSKSCQFNQPKNSLQHISIKDQMITQWGKKSYHIFVQQNPNKVNEMIKKQQQAQIHRAKQIQNLQQCRSISQQSYYKILRKLKQQAKMKIFCKKHKK